jgi:hypothetical protein
VGNAVSQIDACVVFSGPDCGWDVKLWIPDSAANVQDGMKYFPCKYVSHWTDESPLGSVQISTEYELTGDQSRLHP